MIWPYIFFLATLFAVPIMTQVATTEYRQQRTNEVKATSANMLVYRDYVVAFATANPTVTGAVPDASLGLPSWFSKVSTVQNYVNAGRGYIYVTSNANDLAFQLLQDSHYSINVGIKSSGYLQNPLSTTLLPLPAVIPDGSVVFSS
jgi:hypothetical protein